LFQYSGEKVAKYRIEYDREACIGAAACIAVSPNAWKMGEDGKAVQLIKEFEENELQLMLDAARSCPVNVIHIVDEKGKRLI
jgi:ferredoxin